MEFDTVNQFETVIDHIRPLTEEVKIYGVYKRGLWK
jgi:prephenate dehydratase